MSPHLIELQDKGICIRHQGEVLARSPGFASIANKEPVFGEAARELTRLHPRESFNQFWSQLSLDPLVLKNRYFRHSADLAYSHLDQLTRGLNVEHGAVIAAPSNYNRNQLAVLLGVVGQFNFDAVGLVDLSLLLAAGLESDECIVIDLQLHQAVLTGFRKLEGYLVRDQVVQVPASGLLSLHDAWSGMIADEFIRQGRFDPRHNAETEQYVFNQIPHWLAQSHDQTELMLEINHKGIVHQARITREHFEQRASVIFTRIARELTALRTPGSTVHIAASAMSLPGLSRHLPGLIALDEDSTMDICLQHLDNIRRPPDNLNFITRLPLNGAAARAPLFQNRAPTHVLFRHKAIPLPAGRLLFGVPPEGLDCARVIPVPELASGTALALVRTPRAVQVEIHGPMQTLCNGAPAATLQELTLGDQLQLGTEGPVLQLIGVE